MTHSLLFYPFWPAFAFNFPSSTTCRDMKPFFLCASIALRKIHNFLFLFLKIYNFYFFLRLWIIFFFSWNIYWTLFLSHSYGLQFKHLLPKQNHKVKGYDSTLVPGGVKCEYLMSTNQTMPCYCFPHLQIFSRNFSIETCWTLFHASSVKHTEI